MLGKKLSPGDKAVFSTSGYLAFDEKTGQPSRSKAEVPKAVTERAQKRVAALMKHFPLYPELVIE